MIRALLIKKGGTMMTKVIAVVVALICLIASFAYCDDSTSKAILLGTKLIKNQLCVFDYTLRQFQNGCNPNKKKNFVNKMSFLAEDGVNIIFLKYNPLKYDFEITVKDESEKAFDYSKFVDQLSTVFPTQPKGEKKAADSQVSQGIKDIASGMFVGLSAEKDKKSIKDTECSQFKERLNSISAKVEKIVDIKINNDELSAWTNSIDSDGSAGIDAVIKEIESKQMAMDTRNTELTDFVNKIKKPGSSKSCSLAVDNLTALVRLDDDLARASKHVKEVGEQITKLIARLSLSKQNNPSSSIQWNKDKQGLEYSIPEPTSENYKNVKLKIKKLKVQENKGLISYDVVSETVKEFTIHKKEPYVFETGIAVIYSGLRYPKWGTKTVNGQTVVSKAGYEGDQINAALTLNIVFTSPQNDLMYPALQLGVSTAKDAPALLAGGGLRFVGVKSLMIAGGAIFAKGKDLNMLSEGSVITGTADLEADLKNRMFTSWYIALQYNFE
jgi:hypothetical protein